ncbi:J domain-containing protein [Butyrivibrio proteoclasticus]|uniref:J domain-containing protein n=1 Tax=Butyrivibrio proteoclasticus TaxID=43305 RepID=UPI00047E910F|nr:J domain-containing protein [Butyrivibrio proteoclasticus]
MNKSIWQWLEIEPTNDEAEIKKAYSEMCKKYHPVEFPEEFQQLRDSYKQALRIAKRRKAQTAREDNALDDREIAEHKLTETTEYNDSPEYDYEMSGGQAESDEEEKAPEYEFGDYLDNRLTPAQRDLYKMVKLFCELVKQKPKIYGNGKSVNLVMANWDQKPISDHLTSVLVSELIELISQIPCFSKDMIKALDNKLIQGRKGSEFEALKSRLAKLYNPDLVSAKNYKYKLGYDDVTRLFIKIADEGAYSDYVGWIFARGLWHFNKVRFVLSTTYLYIIGPRTRCYLLRETSFDINERTGRLSIRDNKGKKIISFSVGFVDYQAILTMLLRSTSKRAHEMKMNRFNMLMPYEPDKNGKARLFSDYYFWGRELHNFKLVATFLILTVICLCLAPLYYLEMPKLGYLIVLVKTVGIVCFPLIVIFTILAFATGCWTIGYLLSFFKIKSPVRQELKNDISNGKAKRTANGDLCFFERYLIIVDHKGIHLVPYNKIKESHMYHPDSKNKSARITLSMIDGRILGYQNNLIGVLEDVRSLIEEKREACGNLYEDGANPEDKERIHAFYTKMLAEKKIKFTSSYLLHTDIGATYLAHYSLVFVFGMIAFGAFCFCIAGETKPEIIVGSIVLIIMLLFLLAVFYSMRSYTRRAHKDLVEAMIQMMYPDVYKSEKFAVYALDDFLVFIASGSLYIFRYEDIEWISADGYVSEKNSNRVICMCRIDYSVTKNYELMADDMRNIVKGIEKKCPDIKVVKRGKLYDSWNRSRNDK